MIVQTSTYEEKDIFFSHKCVALSFTWLVFYEFETGNHVLAFLSKFEDDSLSFFVSKLFREFVRVDVNIKA